MRRAVGEGPFKETSGGDTYYRDTVKVLLLLKVVLKSPAAGTIPNLVM